MSKAGEGLREGIAEGAWAKSYTAYKDSLRILDFSLNGKEAIRNMDGFYFLKILSMRCDFQPSEYETTPKNTAF